MSTASVPPPATPRAPPAPDRRGPAPWFVYGVVALVLAAAGLSLAVRWRAWRSPDTPNDLLYFYVAGRIWLEGGSPYAVAGFLAHPLWPAHFPIVPCGFGYQPSAWYLAVPLALLPLPVAMRTSWGFNVVSLGVCCFVLYRLIRAGGASPARGRAGPAVLALVPFLGLASVPENLANHQSVLYLTALLLLGLLLLERDRDGWAGLLFGLILYKFSLVLWPVAALALVRKSPRLLLVPLAVHAVLSLPPLVLFPTPVTLHDWRGSIDAYLAHKTNSPYNPGVTTVPALIAQTLRLPPPTLGHKLVHGAYLGVGLATIYVTRGAYAGPRRFAWVALNLVWTLLAGFSHPYDFVVIAPLFVALALGYRDLRPAPALLLGAGLVLLMVPYWVPVSRLPVPAPYHAVWLLAVQLGLTLWLWPRRDAIAAQPPAAAVAA